MKKIISSLLVILFVIAAMAQERTVEKSMSSGDTYIKYRGVAADTLTPTNQDTIDYLIEYKANGWVKKIDVILKYDTIAGADTTVKAQLDGKEFENQTSYTSIITSTASSAVSGVTYHIITSDYTESTAQYTSTAASHNLASAAHTLLTDTTGLSGYPADSVSVPDYNIVEASYVITNAAQTVTPTDKSFRWYRLRLILSGNDVTGIGVKVTGWELKLYTE